MLLLREHGLELKEGGATVQLFFEEACTSQKLSVNTKEKCGHMGTVYIYIYIRAHTHMCVCVGAYV